MNSRVSIQGAGGTLSVGSLTFLGIFLVVDGLSGLYLLIERYAKDSAWPVLFALPALVVSYILGLVVTAASEPVFARIRHEAPGTEVQEFAIVAATQNAAVVERYLDLYQHQVLLEGSAPGFLLLSVGSWFARQWLGSFSFFGWLCALGFAGLAIICPLVANGLRRKRRILLSSAESRTPQR